MIKNATAVKDKIKNKAGGNSEKSQIMLRIYMMERFLERVSVSKYRDNFVLKGGLLVSSLVGVDMRSTMDIDTTVKSLALTQENARVTLEEIMAIDLGDGVEFRITKTKEIMEGHEYEGIRFMIDCRLDKLKQTIKIDISTGDEITPRAVAYKLPLIVEDRTIDLWAYNLETLLAEKLETIMVRAEANTRMRDFYDIHILLEHEGEKMDENILKDAFAATCKRRESENMVSELSDVIDKVHASETLKSQWNHYQRENYYVGEITWDEVCESVKKLESIVQ